MQLFSTYRVKIKHYNHIFKDTISVYRHAVDFLIDVCRKEWDAIALIPGSLLQQQYVERLCHATAHHPNPKYSGFDKKCKCQYKNAQKVENKNVHFIPLSLQTGCQEMLAFP